MPEKTCVTCRHFNGQNGSKNVCISYLNSFYDPVTGTNIEYDCSWLRSPHVAGGCGADGRWWQDRLPEQRIFTVAGAKPPIEAPAGKAQGLGGLIKALGLWPKWADTSQQPS